VVIPLIIVFTGLMIFSILRIIKTYHRQPASGKEDMKGKTAVVREPLNPQGTVFYQGELWNAASNSGKIKSGEEVLIENVKGLMLYVVRKQKF
jgi:membrane-bound serine protease (ClpP class)